MERKVQWLKVLATCYIFEAYDGGRNWCSFFDGMKVPTPITLRVAKSGVQLTGVILMYRGQNLVRKDVQKAEYYSYACRRAPARARR
jgi:hypothetical protein